MSKSKVFLSEKEEQILSTLKKSEKKLTLTDLSKSIESSLPYTSNLVSMLEIKAYIKIERKDKRSKYIVLTTEDERKATEKVRFKDNPQTLNFALKVGSFFMAHLDELPGVLTNKLISSFTAEDRKFLDVHSNRIEEFELTWED